MTNKQDLLNAIIEDPSNDMLRLVYTDWLEENGEPEYAEFIRVQLKLARIESDPDFPAEKKLQLQEQEKTFFEQYPKSHLWFGSPWLPHLNWFRRGFITHVECAFREWIACHAAITRQHPIEEVTLLDDFNISWEYKVDGRVEVYDPRKRLSKSVCVSDVYPGISIDEMRLELLKANWPRIKFSLPPNDAEQLQGNIIRGLQIPRRLLEADGTALHPLSAARLRLFRRRFYL